MNANKQTDRQTNTDPSLMRRPAVRPLNHRHTFVEFGCVEREKLLIIRVYRVKPSGSLDTVADENENVKIVYGKNKVFLKGFSLPHS